MWEIKLGWVLAPLRLPASHGAGWVSGVSEISELSPIPHPVSRDYGQAAQKVERHSNFGGAGPDAGTSSASRTVDWS